MRRRPSTCKATPIDGPSLWDRDFTGRIADAAYQAGIERVESTRCRRL